MASGRGASSRWFFTREQLENTPSRRCGVEADIELSYRQQAANLIQEMGQRLNVSQLTINTAIVYMHRFYMYHSFTKFNKNIISPTALFLAAKVEEQARKLEHVIKVAHACLHPLEPLLDTKCDAYLQQTQELVLLETIMLQTLASKDLAQTSYFMATNSLHLTTFCLQYKPTVIACVCIHLACKWSNWEIPVSTDGKHWWEYVDPTVTLELLDELTHEFLQILEKTPSRLKKIRNWRADQAAKKPKVDRQVSETPLLGSSLVQNSILVDSVAGVPANPSFQKPSTSAFPAPVPLNSGNISVQDSHTSDNLSVLATGMPGTSYSLSSHQEWPQHQESARTEQIYSQKQETSLSGSQYNINFQQGPSLSLHSGLHHRPDKISDHSSIKQEYTHKAGSSKHHGPISATPGVIPQKMSLDKYREKRKLETLDLDVRDHYIAAQAEQQHKHVQSQATSSSSVTSPIKMKIPITNAEKPEKYMADKKEKSGSLKLRIPLPPTDKSASKEELKMKIKVSSERHSSSDEGSGKSKHSSPHISRDHKDKHKEHPSNRHHPSSHKHSHSHSGSSSGGSKHSADGIPPTVLRSPVGLSSDGISSSSSSSRKKLHVNDASHNHHAKMSKSSKSSGSSSSSSSSVKQYISSHNSVFNHPLPPPPPVTYQVGYGHLSTLVKLDKKPVETNGPDVHHEYSTNSQHMDYKDTYDMLDSLLSAQGMNM
ncbi:cyclin-T2 isoform X3 [Myotis yumanensis]|uniref:cyclin-T2 isoform X2 n=1 Tax=Myotis brandtii TaxID=109478 RepID=UPI0003BBE9A5|nr:PREDICTED: cyclin-T2 isoform X2 [Myotis brandtii]XP_036174778.1 cyclin-T2 isoform X3 [Myotis myotis]XP_059560588.1 cyclin-T2 isoform X3 [Myotis daubentonii]